jgi:hydroxyacyl-ACP dehydratase HTD2-like protein with hotdog domain
MPELSASDIGFADEVTADLSVDHLARLALTLDVVPLGAGDPLPLLWHWAAFTPTVPTASLGADGHPPVPAAAAQRYPRRMWGAGDVALERPLVAGTPATRRTEVAGVKEVSGRSGDLLIVDVEHTCAQQGQTCVVERQSIVYRGPGDPVALPTGDHTPPDAPGWRTSVRADPALMFRYSAVTFNSHRIHYDTAYATQVEGYPALVFPGPLTALLVARDAAADAGEPLRSFTFRATAPIFAGSAFTMTGLLDGKNGSASVLRNDGATAMTASYEVA